MLLIVVPSPPQGLYHAAVTANGSTAAMLGKHERGLVSEQIPSEVKMLLFSYFLPFLFGLNVITAF